mmetsp:Transcript_119520/g.333453  ORF Transcript_119520/g.333453 Transcript_119520/m.333453 type:complete len:402 (-) Transcript_119520:263-1468(-)
MVAAAVVDPAVVAGARTGRASRGVRTRLLEVCQLSELLHLVVVPMPRLWRAWLVCPRAQRVAGATHVVEAGALAAVGQCLAAAVRFPWRLQPEVRVDEGLVGHVGGRLHSRSRAAGVAPIAAVRTVVHHTVSASVDDHMRVHAEHVVCRGNQTRRVVQFVVAEVPFRGKPARIVAAWMVPVLTIEAEAVAEALVRAPGALDAQGLVVCHVGGKTPDLWDIHGSEDVHEGLHAVLPAQPAAVGGIEVDRHRRTLLSELVQRILDAILVCRLSGRAPAVRVGDVGREVRQAVRLHHDHDGHFVLVLLQHLHERVDVVLHVLPEPFLALAGGLVVALPIGQLLTANLTIGGVRLAIPVWQVVPHKDAKLRCCLRCGVFQNALEAPVVIRSTCLLYLCLHIDPIG